VAVTEQMQSRLVDRTGALGRDVPAHASQLERGQMGQGRTETGAPDDRVRTRTAAVAPSDAVGSEPGEHRLRGQESGVAGDTDGRNGHDVAQRGDATGVAAAGVESA